ncbi:hypothetical protein [Modestobacter sp. KNN46-3]|uniref:hypothetical protein n=1 Tax=Modestobacter sp. KNN46-3 TaxID=2711218 RepID=UPI0013DFA754|nr:hypothetical protein [Modestobacter sp. KNN46-3]
MTTRTTPTSAGATAPVHDPRARFRNRVELGLLGLVVLALALLSWRRRWTSDDAFINFRVVENLLAGNGPVYNAGERVEVATSTLWLAVITVAEALVPGNAVAWISVVLGIVATLTGVVLASLGSQRLYGGVPRWLAVPCGAVVVAALPPFWDFASSGLETGLSFCWLGASFAALVHVARREVVGQRRTLGVAVLLGMGPLVRPDLALISALLILWLLSVPGSWPARAARVAAAGGLPVAVEVFRAGYYGLLVPNTAVAKESSRAVWGRGADYLADLVGPHLLWLPLALVLAALALLAPRAGWRPREWSLVAVVLVAALLHAAYVVRVGGDFMHGRLLLPSLFLVLCPVMVVPVPALRLRGVAVSAVLTVLAVWAAASVVVLRADYPEGMSSAGITDERRYWAELAGRENPVTLEDHGAQSVIPYSDQVAALHEQDADLVVAQPPVVTPDSGVARIAPSSGGVVFGVGNAGFYGVAPGLEVRVVDGLGLTDPIGSHMEAPPPGRAGHEKSFPAEWFLARYGAPELAEEATTGLPAPADVAAARATLDCGPVRELLEATNAPLTWGRFWDNLTGAPSRTSLRIPADPAEAQAQFC